MRFTRAPVSRPCSDGMRWKKIVRRSGSPATPSSSSRFDRRRIVPVVLELRSVSALELPTEWSAGMLTDAEPLGPRRRDGCSRTPSSGGGGSPPKETVRADAAAVLSAGAMETPVAASAMDCRSRSPSPPAVSASRSTSAAISARISARIRGGWQSTGARSIIQ